MNLPVDIQCAITCDDVRREDNGKALAIGVYVGDILVNAFPASLRLSWLLLGKHHISDDRRIEFKIQSDDVVIARTEIATVEANDDAAIVLPGVPVLFKEPGELALSVKDGEDWRLLVKKKVRLAQAS